MQRRRAIKGRRYLTWIQAGAQGGAGLAAIATGLCAMNGSAINPEWWALSLLEHFRVQYSLMLLLGLALGLGLPGRTVKRWVGIWLVPLGLNVALIAPLLQPLAQPSPSGQMAQQLRLLYITLDHESADVQQVAAYVQRQQADLVFLLEVTPTTLGALQQQWGDAQRLVFADPRLNSHGTAWFVPRRPNPHRPIAVTSAEIMHLPAFSDRPLLKGTIAYGDTPVDLLLFHAARPQQAGSLAFQKQEFAALAEWSRTVPHALIVMGDFNSTPWYGPFRQLLAVSGLVNSQTGFGWQATWPSFWPVPFRLAIDHSLHSRDWVTLAHEIGPEIGSDHLPLTVDLALRSPPPASSQKMGPVHD